MARVTLKDRVLEQIQSTAEKVLLRRDFAHLGGYDQIGRALRALVSDGHLISLGYGLYARGQKDPVTGQSFLLDEASTIREAALARLDRPAPAVASTAGFSRDIRIPPTQPVNDLPGDAKERLSVRLGLEFPYDWSNPNMPVSQLIEKVVAKSRFSDLMRTSFYFGLPRVRAAAGQLDGKQGQLMAMLDNIESGFKQGRVI